MQRNLSGRVEVVTPVWDPALKAKLWEVLDANLRDQRLAWMMESDGTYRVAETGEGGGAETLGTHELLMELARNRAPI